jgi:hypothetical protein
MTGTRNKYRMQKSAVGAKGGRGRQKAEGRRRKEEFGKAG